MTTTTAKQIKKLIAGTPGGDMLILADIDGTMWASNRIWLTRAERVQPFLDEHGIDDPGVYHVNGSTVSQEDGPGTAAVPAISGLLDLAQYTRPLDAISIGDHDEIYVPAPDGYAQLFRETQPSERIVALRADWLAWLENFAGAPGVIYSMRLAATDRAHGPVAVIADPLAPEPGEDAAPQLAAVVMPARNGSCRCEACEANRAAGEPTIEDDEQA
jgi:hypothetical protein